MTVELHSVVGIWCVEVATPPSNFMVSLYKNNEARYEIEARLRLYEDDKAFDSEDKKSFWKIKAKDENVSEEEAIKMCEKLFKEVCIWPTAKPAWKLMKGTMSNEEFLDALSKQPGIHMKRETLQ